MAITCLCLQAYVVWC